MIYIFTRLVWLPVYKIISMIIIEGKYEAPRRINIYLRDFLVMIGSRTPICYNRTTVAALGISTKLIVFGP